MIDLGDVRARLETYRTGRIAGTIRGDDRDHFGDVARAAPAAVLIALIAHDEPSVLLTVRNANMSKHAGQVAFPGGRLDAGETAVEAALREAHEEVDLPPGLVDVIGPLDEYVTGTGYRITPIVGTVPPGLPLAPHEAEVAEVFEVPLAHLLDEANHVADEAMWRGRRRRFYRIDWGPQHIWGATAGIIVNLARVLRDGS